MRIYIVFLYIYQYVMYYAYFLGKARERAESLMSIPGTAPFPTELSTGIVDIHIFVKGQDTACVERPGRYGETLRTGIFCLYSRNRSAFRHMNTRYLNNGHSR